MKHILTKSISIIFFSILPIITTSLTGTEYEKYKHRNYYYHYPKLVVVNHTENVIWFHAQSYPHTRDLHRTRILRSLFDGSVGGKHYNPKTKEWVFPKTNARTLRLDKPTLRLDTSLLFLSYGPSYEFDPSEYPEHIDSGLFFSRGILTRDEKKHGATIKIHIYSRSDAPKYAHCLGNNKYCTYTTKYR